MSDFLSIVRERGFIHQLTDEAGLAEILKQGPQTAYIGFDCTAKSLHVGSLLQIMLLRWWQKTGNKPIVLLGGGTTKIGDPSGKDASRPALSDADIADNMTHLKKVFAEFLTFGDGANDAVMVNNDDWLKDLNYISFLRDYGRFFSVNKMLTMDSVKLRLERNQHLSFLEFNYMILQAYDFVELNRRFDCRVQMGGSDQWGNIIQGINLNYTASEIFVKKEMTLNGLPSHSVPREDLIKYLYTNFPDEFNGRTILHAGSVTSEKPGLHDVSYRSIIETFGITSPLMTTASGAKMGKTADGAVWLNADMLAPYDYWQFWRNTEDADVERFLKLFTELSLDEIAKLAALKGAEINEAKKVLATEATALLHGRAAADEAAATAHATFAAGGLGEDLPEISVASGTSVVAALVQLGFAASNGEARRLIKGGGVKLNDVPVTAEDATLSAEDVKSDYGKLSAGKKRHGRIKVA